MSSGSYRFQLSGTTMRLTKQLWLNGIGACFVLLWVGSQAMTVVPGTSAVTEQWVAGNLFALLAGIAFGAALRTK
jgi:hypothetical protein